MNVFIDLRRNFPNVPGNGIFETTADSFFDVAFGAATSDYPVKVYRDVALTNLFAIVWADGGIDYHR